MPKRPGPTRAQASRPPAPPRVDHSALHPVDPADGPPWVDEDVLTGADLLAGRIEASVTLLEWSSSRAGGVAMAGLDFDRCHLSDLQLGACDLSGSRFPRGSWTRLELADCRLTGLDVSGSQLSDVVVRGGKAGELNLRMATTERLVFDGVDLRGLDAYGADLTGAVFTDCDLTGSRFGAGTCTGTAFTGCRLEGVRGVDGLRGARITGTDLWQIADLMAGALGITVDPG